MAASRVAIPTSVEGACTEWTRSKNRKGYGQGNFKGKPMAAHRAVWMKAHGEIPKGHHVHHKCGNKACINLDHLELVDHVDHSRQHRRFAAKEIQEIRSRYVRGMNMYDRGNSVALAKEYGLSKWAIRNIASGRAYGDV